MQKRNKNYIDFIADISLYSQFLFTYNYNRNDQFGL